MSNNVTKNLRKGLDAHMSGPNAFSVFRSQFVDYVEGAQWKNDGFDSLAHAVLAEDGLNVRLPEVQRTTMAPRVLRLSEMNGKRSNKPSLSIAWAPPIPSSAGWKMKFTVPAKSRVSAR